MSNETFSLKKNIAGEVLALFFNVFIAGVVWGTTFYVGATLFENRYYLALVGLPLFAAL